MPRNDNGSKSDDIHFVCINYSPASYLAGITTTRKDQPMTEQECPKWDTCSAPICPLDAEWRQRTYIKGEGVCRWMLEAAKKGAAAVFQARGWESLYQRVKAETPAILAQHTAMTPAVERASRTLSMFTRNIPNSGSDNPS